MRRDRQKCEWEIRSKVFPNNLEALAVDNAGAGFVVLLLRNPHLLEGGQGGQDGATDPDGVFALRGSDDLDLDGRRGEGGDFLLHTIGDTGVHGGAARQDSVGVQVLADVDVALHDRVVDGLVDSARFHTQERGLEQGLGAAEALVANGDDLKVIGVVREKVNLEAVKWLPIGSRRAYLAVGKLVRLLERGGGSGGGHFLLEVQGDIAQLLLDVTDDFAFSGGGEAVAALSQDLHQVVGQVATSQVQTEDGVGQSITCW